MIIELLGECGADAVSVENKDDVVATPEKLGADAPIFGDIDAYNVPVNGTPEQVEQAVKDAVERASMPAAGPRYLAHGSQGEDASPHEGGEGIWKTSPREQPFLPSREDGNCRLRHGS